MKYYKTSKFTKAITSTGFITITSCALLAVGAVGWFAFSHNEKIENNVPENNSLIQEYPKTNNSYNSDINQSEISEQPITDVTESAEEVPYEKEPVEENTKPQKPTFILPISGNILKGYSDTALQYSATFGDMRLHTGVDISCKKGSNIKSAGSGVVKSVVDDANFGRIITIQHEGDIVVKYCGMGSVNVKENDSVATGDIIGTSGDIPCECADNPHIHIEVFVGGNVASPLSTLGLE